MGSDPAMVGQGVYRGVCEIPGDLLKNGVYNITLMLVKDTATVLDTLERALTFVVADKCENSYDFGKRPGYVRPSLPFPVVALPAAPSQERA